MVWTVEQSGLAENIKPLFLRSLLVVEGDSKNTKVGFAMCGARRVLVFFANSGQFCKYIISLDLFWRGIPRNVGDTGERWKPPTVGSVVLGQ